MGGDAARRRPWRSRGGVRSQVQAAAPQQPGSNKSGKRFRTPPILVNVNRDQSTGTAAQRQGRAWAGRRRQALVRRQLVARGAFHAVWRAMALPRARSPSPLDGRQSKQRLSAGRPLGPARPASVRPPPVVRVHPAPGPLPPKNPLNERLPAPAAAKGLAPAPAAIFFLWPRFQRVAAPSRSFPRLTKTRDREREKREKKIATRTASHNPALPSNQPQPRSACRSACATPSGGCFKADSLRQRQRWLFLSF